MERRVRGGTGSPLSCSQIPPRGGGSVDFLVGSLGSGSRMAFPFSQRRRRSYLVGGRRMGGRQSRV